MSKFLLPVLLITIAFFSACKTGREAKKEIKETVKRDTGVEFIFSKMKDAQFDFRTMNIKFQAKVESEKTNLSFGGSMRIIKDRTIWLSLSAVIGIEAFRVSITPDSVKMINRLNKTYFKGDYQLINDLLKTPFDFDMLQALVTGNDFSYYENNIFKVGEDAKTYKIATPGRKKLKNYVANQSDMDRVLVQDLWIAPDNFKIVRQQIKEISKENSKLVVDYSAFVAFDDQFLAHQIDVNVEADQKMKVIIDFEKVSVDEEITVPFMIPESFSSMDQQQNNK
ncbi:MAG: hypothetical protein A2W93_08635 [Bacteroidetes bacterium GWF2_43_63]|nr:MAG: hypothetical protein A2W94_03160 [Bacteroidetes bacterium GWE2_42_42]OFY55198.1 MAG: hypothetical protein A2W93_08635 [Bacteroidetes bacterium GWF2_43_63]